MKSNKIDDYLLLFEKVKKFANMVTVTMPVSVTATKNVTGRQYDKC